MHLFDQALQLQFQESDETFHGHTAPAYANMVGPFGGITAAAMLKALLDHPARQGEPITLTVNYAAAVKDGPFTIAPQLIRTNRSTQHWFVTMAQADGIVTTATAIFATRRDAWGATDLAFPEFPAAAQALDVSMLPGWVQNYRFCSDWDMATVFSAGSDSAETIQSIQDNPPRPLDFASLTAMTDVFFPRIFARKGKYLPAGTVGFTVNFHADAAALAAVGDGELIGHARANRYHNSYFDQSAELWTPEGQLLVTSTQVVYYKLAP